MNLFNPPKYAKGSLVGVDDDAFSIMVYFRDQAVACGWSKEDVEKVINQAELGDYNDLITTINSHLTTEPQKVFSSDVVYNEAENVFSHNHNDSCSGGDSCGGGSD